MKLTVNLSIVGGGAALVALFFTQLHWVSNTFIHSFMDIAAVLMVAGVAFLQYMYYYTNKTKRNLALFAILLATTLLELFHSFASSYWIEPLLSDNHQDFTSWSWFMLRLYTSAALAYFVVGMHNKDQAASSQLPILSSLVALSVMLLLLFTSQSSAYRASFPLPLVQEILPGLLFAIALYGFITKEAKEQNPFDRWFAYFLALNVVVQLLIIPASHALYDTRFDLAHIFKMLSYSCLLIGISLDIASRFSQQRQAAETLETDTHNALTQLNELIQAARDGNTKKRADLSHFEGDWRNIMEGTNTILDETMRPVNSIVTALKSIEGGNLSTKVTDNFKGDYNQAKDAVNNLSTLAEQVLRELDQLNKEFESGHYAHRISLDLFSGDWRNLLEVVNRVVAAAHHTTETVQAQNWVKGGLAELANGLRSDMEMNQIAQAASSLLARYVDAQIAAFYVFNQEQGRLIRAGGFAAELRADMPSEFYLGEGLVGQVGLEQRELILNDVPTDFSRIISASSEMLPRQLIIMPLLYEGQLKGVFELARVEAFNPLVLELLRSAGHTLGSLLSVLEKTQHTRLLLEQSQKQAEQLQLQQETLKQSNEELEQQTQALRVSEEEMRTQQEELQQMNEDLEMRAQCMEVLVEDFKRQNEELELAQADLTQRAEDLALASKYKGEFLANMSHELRTPLNSMLLLSRSLADNREGNLKEKQVQAAKVMHQSGKDLLGIINDILDLSKIEAGRETLVLGEVNMQEMSSHLALLYEQPAIEKGIKFEVNVDPSLPKIIMSDRQRLGQVLRNLLTNAFKFTSEGGVTLDIKRAPSNTKPSVGSPLEHYAGDMFILAVSDTGIGIPPDKQRHIWEAFQQADGSTSRQYGGTGLGLTISRELSKLLGGEIQLTSEVGKGSTFALLLPLELPSDSSAEQTEPVATFKAELAEPAAVSVRPAPAPEPEKAAASSSVVQQWLAAASSGENNTPPTPPEPEKPAEASSAVQKWLAAAAAAATEGDGLDVMSASPMTETAPPPAPAAKANNKRVADDRDNLGENETVMLIVEKDDDFAETLSKLCREHGTKYLLATTANEAQELIDHYSILGIFLDMLLPARGGWQVLAYLKENPKFMHIPVFVTSSDEEAKRAMNMGAAGFLRKPFVADQFSSLFDRVNEINNKKTKNLLLVEDDPSLRLAVQDLLQAADVNIVEASNGEEALKRIATGDIDLIILDLGLPDMDGFSVLDRAQMELNGKAKLPPVIIFTGRELSREEYERLQVYAANVIVKGEKSDERLVDEASLFLHRRVADLPDHTRKMLASIHDREGMFTNKKVLLVDDDIRNIFALVGLLEARELEVLTAKHGQEALDVLAQNPTIDMILTDIMMPIMDGYELIRQVRSQPRMSRLPIIALTAKAMKEDRERCLEAGASDYLTKPIDPDRLFSMMRVWMYK